MSKIFCLLNNLYIKQRLRIHNFDQLKMSNRIEFCVEHYFLRLSIVRTVTYYAIYDHYIVKMFS